MQIFARVVLWLLATSSMTAQNCFAEAESVETKQTALQPAHTGSVRDTVALAVNNHPEIQASLLGLRVQRDQLKQVESGFFPQVSLAVGIGREDSNNSSTRVETGRGSDEMERREASLFVNQMLFDGFETYWLRKRQLEDIDAAELAAWHLSSEVALRSIENHLNVAKSNKILNDTIDNLQAHERIAKDIGIRARLGKDDRAKVSQISARLSLSLANLEAAKNKVLQANADYRREVGVMPGKKLHFQDKLFRMPDSQNDFLEDVMASNLLIASKVKTTKSFLAGARAASHSDFPTLNLESGASWNNNIDGVEGRNSDAFIMLRLRYDLFKGGADKAVKRQAQYLNKQARYELDDVRRVIRRDAEQAWFSYQSGSKRVSYLQDYVESAQTTQKAYVKQFNIGQRSLIDLLDAENELLSAKRQLIDAKNNLYLSKYQILNLKGTLLSIISIDTAKHLEVSIEG